MTDQNRPNDMEENQAYHEELAQEAPRLAAVPKMRPQGLPEGYLDAFAERLMRRISDEETAEVAAERLAALPLAQPEVPPAYFEQLEGRVFDRIAAEDAQRFLTRLPVSQPAVPAGYFEGLQDRVLARVQADAPTQAPVGKRIGAGWWRTTRVWAAAAVLVLALTATLLVLRDQTPVTPSADQLAEQQASAALKIQLASLEDDAVVTALNQSPVSDEEIFAVMGTTSVEDLELGEAVQDDAAADYLDQADVDDLDFEDLNLDQMDLSDINL